MLDNNFFKEPMPVPAQTSPLDLPVTIEPVLSFHSDDPLIKGALMLFIRDFERYHGVKIKITDSEKNAGFVLFRKKAEELNLKEPSVFEECRAENYSIVLKNGRIVLNYIGLKSLNHALAALLRLSKIKDGRIFWNYSELLDGPQCKYRAFHVDLGRNFHSVGRLFEYIDMCFCYNLSHLHLHFNENQSYTLPSKLYPKLPAKDRHYSFEEIRELNRYALRRGVSLVPEVDIPGHCNAFGAAYPKLFGTSGVICQHEDSMKAVREIVEEVCAMFPYSEYIHVGGDEADILKWTECEKCLAYFETVDKAAVDAFKAGGDGRALAERMLAHFINVTTDVVFKAGRTPIVWEGFNKCVNDLISRKIVVMSWENYYQTTDELLEAGFDIINCSWNPLYIVTPKKMWSPAEIMDWDIFRWTPVHPDSPYIGQTLNIDKGFKKQIWGAQLHAWGDSLAKAFEDVEQGVAKETENIANRLPALALNLWNTPQMKEKILKKMQ